MHSVFCLNYHLALVTKNRKKVINDVISNRAKEIFEKIAVNYSITVRQWHYSDDHFHIIFKAQPNTDISKFVNAYKTASSRLLKKEYPDICSNTSDKHFWNQGFFISTAGELIDDVINDYVESQYTNLIGGEQQNE